MRTAVCLSGQARFISKNFENIRDHLIIPTDADVFCHFWDTEGENLEPQKALEVFQPVIYALETQKVFDTDSYSSVRSQHNQDINRYQNIHSMQYSICQANLLKHKYEQEHGFLYDCVIRSRTDISFETVFDFSEIKKHPNYIWLRQYDKSPAGISCADLFAFSNSEQMDIYSDFFNHLPKLVKERCHLFAETLLHDYLSPRCEITLSKMRYSLVRN